MRRNATGLRLAEDLYTQKAFHPCLN
jgi:hypothetical protein